MISFQETLEDLYIEPRRKKEMSEESTGLLTEVSSRPDWDTWFLTLCFVIAQKSLDKHTKHGCVVIDDSNTILSVGYNGPPRGCSDNHVPLERPTKYFYMEHSESNAIVNAARSGISLVRSTFYITGPPCHSCFAKIKNVGATKIVHGPTPSAMVNEESNKIIQFMNSEKKVEIRQIEDVSLVVELLKKTDQYIARKIYAQENSSANS